MSILLGFGNMTLLDALLRQPLGQNVVHALWWEGNREGEIGLILGHSSDLEVLGIWKVRKRRVVDTKKLSDFAHTIGAVIEEK
jgi:hypothetical protein